MRDKSSRNRGNEGVGGSAPDSALAMESIRATNEKLTAIIQNSPLAIITLDPRQRVMTCNPAAERMFGWSEQEIIGRPYPLIPPEGRAGFEKLWAELHAGKVVSDREVRRRCKDGRLLDVSLSVAFLHDSEGRVSGYLGMMADITERKRAESEREHSMSLLRAALESTEDGILVTDLEGNVVTFNERFLAMWPVPPDIARDPGAKLRQFAASQMQNPEAFARLRQRLLDHPRHEARDMLTLKDGRLFERYSRPQLIAGEPVGRVYSFRNVTERVRAEEDIRALNRRLEGRVRERTASLAEANSQIRRKMRELRALNGMAAAIAATLDVPEQLGALAQHFSRDLQVPGGMFFVSGAETAALQMECCWGLPTPATQGLAGSPETIPGLGQCLRRRHVVRPRIPALQDGAPGEIDLIRPTIVPVLTQARVEALLVLWNWHGRSFGDNEIRVFRSLAKQVGLAMQNARLFTELRASHERLQALSRRVVDVQERERRHLARELHDEIGQTLTGIKLSLEMLRRQTHGKPEVLDRAQQLVNDLMSRAREISLNLRPAMLDDLGLVPALLWLIDSYTAHTGIRVDFQHAGGGRLPQEVETAAFRIVQEALTNVARHSRALDARVRLSLAEGQLVVQIEDDGPGFDAAAALASLKTIGLPGMMERATLLGGHLSVITSPGEGTQIVASLPLGRDADDGDTGTADPGETTRRVRRAGAAKAEASRRERDGGSDDNNSAGG